MSASLECVLYPDRELTAAAASSRHPAAPRINIGSQIPSSPFNPIQGITHERAALNIQMH